MKKAIDIVCKVLLSLMCVMQVIAGLGLLPPPTADLYNTPEAFSFIMALMGTGYITPIMGVVFLLTLICLWTKREALAALLLLPLTVNIVAFHLMLDGGLFTPGAVLGNILALLNIYFLYQYRAEYRTLLAGRK